MTIVEAAKAAQPYQRVVRSSWSKPYRFWYFFNMNGCMKTSDEAPDLLLLFKYDLIADDWKLIEEDQIAEDLRAAK